MCDRSFATDAGLRQHRRYYCGPDDGPDYPCGDCERVFTTKSGRTLHRKRFHPDQHNMGLETKSRRKAEPASALEMHDLVCAELDYDGLYVNRHLSERFDRPAEWIKKLRKTVRYQSLRDNIRSDREEADDIDVPPLPAFPPPDLAVEVEDEVFVAGPGSPERAATPPMAAPPSPEPPPTGDGIIIIIIAHLGTR